MDAGSADDGGTPRYVPLNPQPDPDPEWEERHRAAPRVESLDRPRDIVLPWDAAVQLAHALLFYIRSWEEPDAGTGVRSPAAQLLLDCGQLAADAERLLPGDVVSTAADLQERYEEPS